MKLITAKGFTNQSNSPLVHISIMLVPQKNVGQADGRGDIVGDISVQGFTAKVCPCHKRRTLNKEIELVKPEEIRKLEAYFKRTFNPQIVVKARPRKDDSAEVYLDDEFLGIVFRDDEDGDLSFNFSMAILDIDL